MHLERMVCDMVSYFAKVAKFTFSSLIFASLIDILSLLIVEDIGILDGNVVNHSLCAVSNDAVVISFSEYVKRRL